jgi:hypothetical protein
MLIGSGLYSVAKPRIKQHEWPEHPMIVEIRRRSRYWRREKLSRFAAKLPCADAGFKRGTAPAAPPNWARFAFPAPNIAFSKTWPESKNRLPTLSPKKSCPATRWYATTLSAPPLRTGASNTLHTRLFLIISQFLRTQLPAVLCCLPAQPKNDMHLPSSN